MLRQRALFVVGASVSLIGLVVPRLPLLPTGLGSGRMSLSATAGLCGSALGQLGAALSGTVAQQCAQISLASGIGWLVFSAGVAVVGIGAVMRLRELLTTGGGKQ